MNRFKMIIGMAVFPFVIVLILNAQEQSPKLPSFPQRTWETLYEQMGQCNADLGDLQKYMQSLAAEIKKRDDEIAKLKEQLKKVEEKP